MAIRARGTPRHRKRTSGPVQPQKPNLTAKESSSAKKTPPASPSAELASEADLTFAAGQQQDKAASDFAEASKAAVPEAAKNPLQLRMAAMQQNEPQDVAAALVDEAKSDNATTSAATSARGSLGGAAMFTSAPGRVGRPQLAEDGDEYATLAYGARGAWTKVKDANDDGMADSSHTAGATVNRAGLSVSSSKTTADGLNHTGTIFAKKGFMSVSGGNAWATADGGASRAGATVGASLSSMVLGGSFAHTDRDGLTHATGAVASVSLDRKASDLGDYSGTDDSLQGTRRIQVKKNIGGSAVGTKGLGLPTVGLGGRLSPSKGKTVTFRTHVSQDKARAVVHEGRGAAQFFRDKARAMGLKEENVTIPDLSKPETMQVGDELVVQTTGGLTGAFALGLPGIVNLGGQATLRGDFEVAARKLNENQVELCVTPTQVRGLGISAQAPMVLEVTSNKTHAASLRQSFVFDLSNPEARAAYEKALKGELPIGTASKAKDAPKGGADLAAMIQNENLPQGVERTYLERVDLTNRTFGGGLNWGVIHTGWGVTGLAAHVAKFSEKRSITDGSAALDISTRGIEKRRQVLLSGTETLGVTSSIKNVTTFDADANSEKRFASVHFGAKFTDDAVRGFELNREMIGQINGAFGTSISEFKEKGRKQSRTINLSMELTENALAQLHTAPQARYVEAGIATRIDGGVLLKLQQKLEQAQTPQQRAEHLQDFICKHGFKGMGALHRVHAATGDTSLQISTSSNAYTEPSSLASSYAFEFKEPIASADGAKETIRRFKAGWDIKNKVEDGLNDLLDDPMLTDAEKTAIKEQLLQAKATVEAKLSFSHLNPAERRALYEDLGNSFWMSAPRVEIRALLFQAGLEDGSATA